jgi:hypothetical protein
MRLFDLIEQQHAMRVLVDAVGQQPALVEPDIAGRSADETADRVALHVLRHVEAQHLDPERGRKLLGRLGLADARRPGEQVGADRLLGVAQAALASLIADVSAVIAGSCPYTTRFNVVSRLARTSASSFDTVFGGIRAIVAMVASISLMPIVFLRRCSGTSICEAPSRR